MRVALLWIINVNNRPLNQKSIVFVAVKNSNE